ncbi:cation-dependent mannose-6-phosphate receptor isoform X2 [Fundulus heteroclitus]|uniref:cation-dependent mannose-6-phosphate receptor isoform X2 n=1 Tax=Fundulus heteroclitus TaxID=8078 RepID=UPI00165BC85E|nr:cation-dependent mannose-6-phosphate receptor isoform X2 [Fundulus heteroclitus]
MKLFRIARRGYVLLWALLAQLVLCRSGVFAGDGTKACVLAHETASERKVLDRLEPLAFKNLTVESKNEKDSYTYVFQLCGDAGGVPGAGVIQKNMKTPEKPIVTNIGSYKATKAIGGSDWVMLIYEQGDKYDSHCQKEARKAIIMISCSKNTDVVKETLIGCVCVCVCVFFYQDADLYNIVTQNCNRGILGACTSMLYGRQLKFNPIFKHPRSEVSFLSPVNFECFPLVRNERAREP